MARTDPGRKFGTGSCHDPVPNVIGGIGTGSWHDLVLMVTTFGERGYTSIVSTIKLFLSSDMHIYETFGDVSLFLCTFRKSKKWFAIKLF